MNEPQRFTVRHVSIYRYSEPVRFGEHRMMFRPRASHDLRLVTNQLVITPTPSRLHWLHDVFDRPYWSLAQHLKSRFPGAKGYIERYQNATLAAARKAGVDGVVCGHIHRAAFTEVDGLLYCNDGDWVESCTALVEDQSGKLSLLEWRPTAATIAAAAVSVSAWAQTIVSVDSEQEAA